MSEKLLLPENNDRLALGLTVNDPMPTVAEVDAMGVTSVIVSMTKKNKWLPLCTFLAEHEFLEESSVDPKVKRYVGHYLPESIMAMLRQQFSDFSPLVSVNLFDNTDVQLEPSVSVEVGIQMKSEPVEGQRPTFGLFGSSSAFCHSLGQAFQEAVNQFLFLYRIDATKIPATVAWRRRFH